MRGLSAQGRVAASANLFLDGLLGEERLSLWLPDAIKAFFANMPVDGGMAFVLVQHLAPHDDSMLAKLVSRQTAMAVVNAEHGAPVTASQPEPI